MPLRLLVLAAALTVPSVAVSGPRDDLLRLVPDDYTFCVVVQNLRDQGKEENNSSFLKGLAESPVIRGLQAAPEAQKFQQAFDTILKDLGVTPGQLRDDLLGDALVFAYRKGPIGQEGREDGLILLHARDEKLLRRLVDRIIEMQTKSGEIKGAEPVGEGAGRYFRRVKMVEGEPPDFFAVHGHRLAFSGNEALLKGLLPQLSAEETGVPPIGRRMRQLGVSESPVAMLVNPRSFDADVLGDAQSGKGSEQAFLKQFATYWKAVDGLAVFVNFHPSIEVGLSVNVRKADLPKPAARFFAEAGKRSPLWDRIPDDALFAFAGRVDLESMTAMLGAFLTEPDRKKVIDAIADASRPFLETEDYGSLARGFGPDMGFWVTAPVPGSTNWCPHAVLAAKVADGPDGREAERAALRGLDFLARLASLQHKGLRVQTAQQGPVEVHYLTHPSAFPPGFRPAFASKGGYIVFADSPETLNRFEPPTGSATDADEVPILRISAAGWRKYLKDHRGPALEYLAGLKGADPKEFGRHLDVLLPMLEGLDRLELVQRSGPDRAMLVVRLREAKK
jgi:hypothetical protein